MSTKDKPGRAPADPSGSTPVQEEVIPLTEETVRIDKRETVTGHVRIRTVTDTVEEFAEAQLQSTSVEVERVPVNRMVDRAPDIRTEGDVTIIPVVEEVLVVEKRLVVTEELHVRRRQSEESVEVPVSRRKQRAVVERTPSEEPEDGSGG